MFTLQYLLGSKSLFVPQDNWHGKGNFCLELQTLSVNMLKNLARNQKNLQKALLSRKTAVTAWREPHGGPGEAGPCRVVPLAPTLHPQLSAPAPCPSVRPSLQACPHTCLESGLFTHSSGL